MTDSADTKSYEEIVDEIDRVWAAIDKNVHGLTKNIGTIKRQKYEADLLACYGDARDKLTESLRLERAQLIELFGGDCVRISRLSAVLEKIEFSTPGAINDRRIESCKKMCANVIGVLRDLGLSAEIQKAQVEAAQKIQVEVESPIKPSDETGQTTPKSITSEPISVISEPSPNLMTGVPQLDDTEIDTILEEQLQKSNPFDMMEHLGRQREDKQPCNIQVVSNSLDDEQTKMICSTKSLDELRKLECPHRTKYPGPWMVYQTQRAHLNDPKLTSLDFTNMHMPTAKNEPAIATKLLLSLKHNTNLSTLILDNSNLQSVEMISLAESLMSNTSVSVLNLDNNAISNEALMKLAGALVRHKNSGLKLLQLYNQLTGEKNNAAAQERLLQTAQNGSLISVLFEFEEPIKTQINALCDANYENRPCCVGCTYPIPIPLPPEAQCDACRRYVCGGIRKCPLDFRLKTVEEAFEKGLPFELVGFPQHCWRNAVELDNLRSLMRKDSVTVVQAMEGLDKNLGKLCKYCIASFTGDALVEYYRKRKEISVDRPPCEQGKDCRIQTHNMKHARSYDHVVLPASK